MVSTVHKPGVGAITARWVDGSCGAWALAVIAAALTIAQFPPLDLWWISLISPVPLLLLAGSASRQRYLAVGVAFFIAWMLLERWLLDVTLPGYPGVGIYMAAWTCLLVWLVRRVSSALKGNILVAAPLSMVTLEWLRGSVVLDGYPWFLAGTPLIEFPLLAQGAEMFGAVWGTILVGIVSASLVRGIETSGRGLRPIASGVALAAAAIVVAMGLGWVLQSRLPAGASIKVLVVQTNLPTSNKLAWKPEDQLRDAQRFASVTREGVRSATLAGRAPDLAVWPETMLPGFGLEAETIATLSGGGYWPGSHFADLALDTQVGIGVPLIVGSPTYLGLKAEGDRWEWDRHYNSAYLIVDGVVRARADKLLLTPFGETMPYISNWDWLERQLLSFGAKGMSFDLSPGEKPTPLVISTDSIPALRLATPICFEDTVSSVCRTLCFKEGVRTADLMVNLSNDGWFGGFDGGRWQHLQLARWRCVELRTPMIRAANTGISCAIDAGGRVVTKSSPRSECYLETQVATCPTTSLVAKLGDVTSPLMSIVCAIMILGRKIGGLRSPLLICASCVFLLGCSWRHPPQLPATVSGSEWSTKERSVQPEEPVPLAASRKAPLEAPETLDDEGLAIELLRQAALGSDDLLRAHALEALGSRPEVLVAVVPRSLGNPNKGVRFVAAMASGNAADRKLLPLVEPLLLDEDPSVKAAAIYALVRMGRLVDQSPLASMVLGRSGTQRANAFMILGDLGNPSAIPLIRAGMDRSQPGVDSIRTKIVDLQGAEALFKLGDTSQSDPIRAALLAPAEQAELIALGCQIAGEIRDRESAGILNNLLTATPPLARPLEIRLAAAAALAKMKLTPLPQVYEFAASAASDPDPWVRAQAAATLGALGGAQALERLRPLLRDQSPLVQVAAAAAILEATPKSITSAPVR